MKSILTKYINTSSIRIYLHKKHFCFLLLNTFLSILMLIGCLRYSVFDSYHPSDCAVTDDLNAIYKHNGQYIDCTAPVLYYSGYDYLLGNQLKGHYYYSLNDEKCTIFLISCDYIDHSDIPPETLENVSIKARLLKHDSNMKPLLDYIADDLKWNYNSLSNVTDKYIISEVDYFPEFNHTFLAVTILLLFSNLIFLIAWIIRCKRKK